MALTLALLNRICSLAMFIILGFISVRLKLFSYEDSKVLSRFAVYVLSPCAMLDAFFYEFSPDKLSGLGIALLGALLATAVFFLLSYAARKPLRLGTVDMNSMLYPNAGNFMLPLIAGSMGGDWVIYCSPFMLVMNILLFTHCKSTIAGERGFRWSMLYKNILVIASLLGFAMFLLNIRLPGPVGEAVSALGDMMGPVFMFVVGMVIGNAELKKVFFNLRAYAVCFGRLVVYPLAALLVLRLSGLHRLSPDAARVLTVVVLTCGAPAAVMVTQFCQLYRSPEEAEFASVVNILSTLLCLATMPCLAYLYQLIAF